MSVVQTIHLKVADLNASQVIHGVQGDTDRVVKMVLDDLGLTSGMTATINFHRPDNTYYSTSATLGTETNSFSASLTQGLTIPGRVTVQLKVTSSGNVVSTFSFYLMVQATASGTVTPQEGIDLVSAVQAAEDAADAADASADRAEAAAELVDAPEIWAAINVLNKSLETSKASAGTKEVAYSAKNGDILRITNDTSAGLNVRLRAASGGTNLQTISVPANSIEVHKAETDFNYISYYFNAGGKTIIESGRFIETESISNDNQTKVDAPEIWAAINVLNKSLETSKASAGTKEVAYSAKNGDILRITNDTSAGLNVRLRAASGGTNLQTISVPANSIEVHKAETDFNYISYYFNAGGKTIIESGRFIETESISNDNQTKIAEITNGYSFTKTQTGGVIIEHTTNVGDAFRVTNTTSENLNVRFRATSDGENLQEVSIAPNSIGYVIAFVNASYIQLYFQAAGTGAIEFGRLPDVEEEAHTAFINSVSELNNVVLEQGGITSTGQFTTSLTRLRTKTYLTGKFTLKVPDGYKVAYACFFDRLGYFKSYTNVNNQVAVITVPENQFCKLTFSKNDNTQNIAVSDIKASLLVEDTSKQIDVLNTPPMVKFTFDHDLDSSVATIVADKQYAPSTSAMADIYSFFDSLVDNDYVTKVDLASEMDISYPAYADYYTYMYKLICSNQNINTGQPKKKVIILGGVHGDEQAAPFNLYIFAQKLCNDYLLDENVFKLRSAFDFYIVPCLNGYGLNHSNRLNGNGVNINRNFPIEKWAKSGSAGDANYTGETAGSEFETQLVMALFNSVKPDMFIDHHNYTYNLDTQFYTNVWDSKQLKLVYQALADISYTLKKNLPDYFGTGFDFVKNNGGSPSVIGDTIGGTARWAFEQFTPFSATIEIGDCITYWGGEHAGTSKDSFGEDTFTVAEYTLRNQMLHYGQWVLDFT